MNLLLYDYAGNKTIHEVGNLEDIVWITIDIISGDEIATVIYKNYDIEKYDSSHDRRCDYPDGSYDIYDIRSNLNRIDDWEMRSSNTYDYLHKMRDIMWEKSEEE